MSDTTQDTPNVPPPLHEGKLYTIEPYPHGDGIFVVSCDGVEVLSVTLLDSELPAFRRLVSCRNVIDGPQADHTPDSPVGRAIAAMCSEVDRLTVQRIARRLRFAGLLAEEGDSEAIILEEIQKAWKPQLELEGGDR